MGIAADEPKRIKSERYPLVDWGITEKEALQICYDRGYDTFLVMDLGWTAKNTGFSGS